MVDKNKVADFLRDKVSETPNSADQLIEAVARAICTSCGENPEHQGDCRGNEKRWQDYSTTATDAIIAVSNWLRA